MESKWSPEEIAALRSRFGDTREQFAVRIGTTGPTVFRWETGRARPQPFFIQRLEEIAKAEASQQIKETA